MTGALTLVVVRQWRLHKLRLVLTTLGIALGVAVFFAIRTTNTTLIYSLHNTIDKLAGKATLQLTAGDSGFSESYLKVVRATPGVAASEPVTETMAFTGLGGGERLLILGLDTSSDLSLYNDMFEEGAVVSSNPLAFASLPDSIAVSKKFADRMGLRSGAKIPIETVNGTRNLTVRAIFRSSCAGEVFDGNVAVMDIAAAQDAFDRGDRIDRIDLINSADVNADELQQTLTSKLPDGIKVMRPDLRGQSLESSVATVNFALTILSFLAFIICAFLIFNSFGISVQQRWKEIGVLRAIGVTRGGIQRMFLGEAAVIGLIGAIFGVGLGFLLARAGIGIVLSVSQSLYGIAASPRALEFNYRTAAIAFVIGIVASVIAAWVPALAASRIDPAAALHNIEVRKVESGTSVLRLVLGVFSIATGLFLSAFYSTTEAISLQLFYIVFIYLGMILLLPAIITVGGRILRPLMQFLFKAEGVIAVENMTRAPTRTASTVGALMVGLAFVFSTGAYIISQKAAINRSLDRSLNCDIQVSSSQQLQSSSYHFSEAEVHRVLSLEGIAVADPIRVASVDLDGDTISVLAHDMNAYFALAPDLLDTGDNGFARKATSSGQGILVANNLAVRRGLTLGDRVRLDTPGGSLELPVVGTVDYFRNEKGTIFIDDGVYEKYWNDNAADYIFIGLKKGVDKQAFKRQVSNALGSDRRAFVYTMDEFKQWVDALVDQFFTLMYLQVVVAIFVAALSLANTMIISVDERRRELGIFRAIGGLRRQVIKLVLLEAVAISLIGLFAGAVAGVFNAYYLVDTAVTAVSGYTIRLLFPHLLVWPAIPVVILIALVAALVPAVRASRLHVVEAIGYE